MNHEGYPELNLTEAETRKFSLIFNYFDNLSFDDMRSLYDDNELDSELFYGLNVKMNVKLLLLVYIKRIRAYFQNEKTEKRKVEIITKYRLHNMEDYDDIAR